MKRMIQRQPEELGSFSTGGILVICDPCYKRDYEPPLVNRIEVAPGIWEATVSYFSGRISLLEAGLSHAYAYKKEQLTDDAGVDSGQFGFFDDTIFPYYQEREFDDKEKFYGKCCDITLSDKQAGIIDGKGVVSSSGFGDGSYNVIVGKDRAGRIVQISVEFISEEEY